MSIGILQTDNIPLPLLLDAINHAEVGHLTRAQASDPVASRSSDDAYGHFQFLQKNLGNMGYGMPDNIPFNDLLDYNKSRALASTYVTNYTSEHGFKTPLEQLVAYTAGPTFAADWVARGANIEELGPRTQSYIKRAAQYLTDNQEPPMAEMTFDLPFFGPVPFSESAAMALQDMADAGNPTAQYGLNRINEAALIEATEQRMRDMAGNAPPPALAEVRSPDQIRQQYNSTAVPMPDPALGGTGSGILVSSANAAETGTAMSPPYYNENGMLTIPIERGVGQGENQAFRMPQPTYKRRDDNPLATPKARQDLINNELLIRMGLAGTGASAKGGLAAFGAMGKEYSAYKDSERAALAKYAAAMAKKKGGGSGSAMSGVIVNDALNRVDPLLSGWSTGVGSYLNMMPMTDAKKVKNLLATIKGNIGFDKLQAMRDASPTGGALGQVSERELSFLQSVFGSLEQDQSADELRYNLGLLRYVYNSIIHGEGNHPYQMPSRSMPSPSAASGGGGLSQDDQALLDKYNN